MPTSATEYKRVYLDYGATSPLDSRALEQMMPYLTGEFGNASTLYSEGKVAATALEQARRNIARVAGCRDPYEIVLTSGGTESTNTAITGIVDAAYSKMKKSLGPGHVICSEFEHKAVLEPIAHLKRRGMQVSYVKPRENGIVCPSDLEPLIRPDTLLVSVMSANNEIGTIQPIEQLAQICHMHGVPFHTDAVAAMGKMRMNIAQTKVDAMSFTAHKICGPKGVGALYISKKVPFNPVILGGGQERGKRSGTSDVASAVGFAATMQIASEQLEQHLRKQAAMRDALIEKVTNCGLPISTAVNIEPGDIEHHLASLVPLMVRGMQSEELVRMLDQRGFAVSGGSACTSTQAQTSHVLQAIGADDVSAQGFVRVTFGRFTTSEQLDAFADALIDVVRSELK